MPKRNPIPGTIVPESDQEMWELIECSLDPRGTAKVSVIRVEMLVLYHKFCLEAMRQLRQRVTLAQVGLDKLKEADQMLLHVLMANAGLSFPPKPRKKKS